MSGISVLPGYMAKDAKDTGNKLSAGTSEQGVSDNFKGILSDFLLMALTSEGHNSGETADSLINTMKSAVNSGTVSDSETAADLEKAVNSEKIGNDSKRQLTDSLAGFLLQFAPQVFQSDFPAGKEANSGEQIIQESHSLMSQSMKDLSDKMNLKQEWTFLKEVFAQTGMKQQRPQGQAAFVNTELDEYKNTINFLLKELSGEIEFVPEMLKFKEVQKNPYQQMFLELMTSNGTNEPVIQKTIDSGINIKNSSLADVKASTNQSSGNEAKANSEIQEKLAVQIKDESSASQSGDKQTIQRSANYQQEPKDVTVNALNTLIQKQTQFNAEKKGVYEKNIYEISQQKHLNSVKSSNIDLNTKNSSQIKQPLVIHSDDKTTVQNTLKQENVQNQKPTGETKESSEKNGNEFSNVIGSEGIQKQEGAARPEIKNIASQIGKQLTETFEKYSPKSQEVKQLELRLQPEDLGKINISIRWENDQLHLHLRASEAATGNILQHQLNELRQSLQNSGIACGMFEMGFEGGQQDSQGSFNRHNFHEKRTVEESLESKEFSHVSQVLSESNTINVTA